MKSDKTWSIPKGKIITKFYLPFALLMKHKGKRSNESRFGADLVAPNSEFRNSDYEQIGV